MKKLLSVFGACLLALALVAAAPPALVPTINGAWLTLGKPAAVGTCSAVSVGAMVQQLGGSSQGRTKICICGSDGAASPAYAWCSWAVTHGAAMVCTGGTTTSCP